MSERLTTCDMVPWREDGDGPTTALHIRGHVDPDDAVLLAWLWCLEYDYDVSLRRGGPRHVWLRTVPWHREDEKHYGGWDGTMQFVLSKRGPGATPVTLIEFARPWDSKRCHCWPSCHEPAVRGLPVSLFIDPPADAEYVYYCRAHAAEIDDRIRAARLAVIMARSADESGA